MEYKEKINKLMPKLSISPLLGGKDLNFDNKPYEDCDIRIIILQMDKVTTKLSSSTIKQLTMLVRQAEERLNKSIYIDFAFMPSQNDIEILRKEDIPEIFGWNSYHQVKDFDLVITTFSIHFEVNTIWPTLWGARIPDTSKERFKDDTLPMVMGGGVVTPYMESVFGYSGGSPIDVMNLGEGEDRLPDQLVWLFDRPDQEWRKNKLSLVRGMVEKFDNVYYPDGYVYDWDDENLCVKGCRPVDECTIAGNPEVEVRDGDQVYKYPGIKILEKREETGLSYDTYAPVKRVDFYRSFNRKPPMFEQKLMIGNNDSAHKAELQISHGCSGSGSCYFKVSGDTRVQTDKGSVKIRDLKGKRNFKIQGFNVENCKNVFKQEDSLAYKVSFDRGNYSNCDLNHKWVILEKGKLVEKRTYELRVGDHVLIKRGWNLEGSSKLSFEEAFVIGFIHGDGFGRYVSDSNFQVYAYLKPEEETLFKECLSKVGWGYQDNRVVYKKEGIKEVRVLVPLDKAKEYNFFKKCTELSIPEILFRSNKEVLWGYVSGLFQSDGWVNKCIGLTSCNPKFIREVQQILWGLGVDSVVRDRDISRYYPDLKEKYGSRNLSYLRIRGEDRNLFLENTRMIKSGLVKDYCSSGSKAEIPVDYLRGLMSEHMTRSEIRCCNFRQIDMSKSGHTTPETLRKLMEVIEVNEVYKKLSIREFVVTKVTSIEESEVSDMYDLVVEPSHLCVFDSVLQHNCAEGTEAGPWREYDYDTIVKNIDKVIKVSAPNSLSFFSYNSNYYSRVFDLYDVLARKVNNLSVIAFRADVLSRQPEYVDFLKTLGTMKITVALEGISDRIRGPYLNKNLSWEDFLKCAEYVIKAKFISLKVNLIFTGHEKEEDFEEFKGIMKKINDLKSKYGAKTSIAWSATTLVEYPHTGMHWFPRMSTYCEINKIRLFKSISEACKEMNQRIRFNSGSDFIYQQFILDAGRELTDEIRQEYKETWDKNGAMNCQAFFTRCNNRGFKKLGLMNSSDEFNKEELDKFLKRSLRFNQPFYGVHFKILNDGYRKLLYSKVGKSGLKYCLKTPAMENPKCNGCGVCPSKEFMVNSMINRSYGSKKTYLDVCQTFFDSKPHSSLRIVYKINSDVESRYHYKLVHSHYVVSQILKNDDFIFENYHSVQNCSDYKPCQDDMPDYWHGISSVDIHLKCSEQELKDYLQSKGEEYITSLIEKANQTISSSKIIRVINIPLLNPRNQRHMEHVYRFESILHKSVLMEKFSGYNNKIKVIKFTGASPLMEEVPYDKDKFVIYVGTKDSKSVGYFTLDNAYNPIFALSSFFGVPVKNISELFDIQRVAMQEVYDFPSAISNKFPAGIDFFSGKVSKLSPQDIAFYLASKI